MFFARRTFFARRLIAMIALALSMASGIAGSTAAHAQGGGSGNVGNGGSGGEPEFRLLRDLLIQWIELGALNVDVSKSPKPVDWKEILEGLRTIPFQFDPTGEPKRVGNSKDRACTSYTASMPGGRRIECNLKLWTETPEADKLAVVAHEFMGAMEYEPNYRTDFSEYWFSSQLVGKLRGKSGHSLGVITPDSFDASVVRPAPTEVLIFARSLMKKNAQLKIHPEGVFELHSAETFYRSIDLTGVYLKNGDYYLAGVIGKGFGGQIGPEKFTIRQAGCPSIRFELVYTVGLGIRSITTETQCFIGDFDRGFNQSKTEIEPDGSVIVQNQVLTRKPFSDPIEIRVDGVEYHERYVHPQFRSQSSQKEF